jgi:hypothetical protein
MAIPARRPEACYYFPMEVQLTPEAQAVIDRLVADGLGRPEDIVNRAVENMVPPDWDDPALASVLSEVASEDNGSHDDCEVDPDSPLEEFVEGLRKRVNSRAMQRAQAG